VIVGARRPSQIAETAQAADMELKPQDLEEIEVLLKQFKEKVG
jgi:aryl-alcohol dehydrogenase-like predicted oxidoreductase